MQSRGWPTVSSRQGAVRIPATSLTAPSVEHPRGEARWSDPLGSNPAFATCQWPLQSRETQRPSRGARTCPHVQVWGPRGLAGAQDEGECKCGRGQPPILWPINLPGPRTVSPRASVSPLHRDEGHGAFLKASHPSCGRPPPQAQETQGRTMCSDGLLVTPNPLPRALKFHFGKHIGGQAGTLIGSET